MQRKLTITIDEAVYEGLYHKIGPGKISPVHRRDRAPARARRQPRLGVRRNGPRRDAGAGRQGVVGRDAGRGDARRQRAEMNRGEVWWVSFSPARGGEIRKRCVLPASNENTRLFTSSRNATAGYTPSSSRSLLMKSSVITSAVVCVPLQYRPAARIGVETVALRELRVRRWFEQVSLQRLGEQCTQRSGALGRADLRSPVGSIRQIDGSLHGATSPYADRAVGSYGPLA